MKGGRSGTMVRVFLVWLQYTRRACCLHCSNMAAQVIREHRAAVLVVSLSNDKKKGFVGKDTSVEFRGEGRRREKVISLFHMVGKIGLELMIIFNTKVLDLSRNRKEMFIACSQYSWFC